MLGKARSSRIAGRKWLRSAAIIGLALLWHASVGFSLAGRTLWRAPQWSVVRLQRAAEAASAVASASAIETLKAKLQEKVGRPLTDKDIVYNLFQQLPLRGATADAWLAQLVLPCLKDAPQLLGRVVSSKKDAKRSVAEIALGTMDLETFAVLEVSEPLTQPTKPPQQKQGTPPKLPDSQLRIGDSLNGTVTSIGAGRDTGVTKYVLVDVGAERLGYLARIEFSDGFTPRQIPTLGTTLNVRVLASNGDYYALTCRSGVLPRVPYGELPRDPSVFGADEWLEGEAVAITDLRAVIKVASPSDGNKFTSGLLNKQDCKGEFAEDAALGAKVRVRLKGGNPRTGAVYLTMLDADGSQANITQATPRVKRTLEEIQVGQEVTGLVRNTTKKGGVWVDVGAEQDGFLAPAEMRDGFPNNKVPAQGTKVDARVLSKVGDRLTLTRRSGDLQRPAATGLPRMNTSVLAGFPRSQWLEGEVMGMTLKEAMIKVVLPSSGLSTVGLLTPSDFAEGFSDTAALGGKVKVWVKDVRKGNGTKERVVFTMKEGHTEQDAATGAAATGDPLPPSRPSADAATEEGADLASARKNVAAFVGIPADRWLEGKVKTTSPKYALVWVRAAPEGETFQAKLDAKDCPDFKTAVKRGGIVQVRVKQVDTAKNLLKVTMKGVEEQDAASGAVATGDPLAPSTRPGADAAAEEQDAATGAVATGDPLPPSTPPGAGAAAEDTKGLQDLLLGGQ